MGYVYGAKHQQTELYFVKIAKKETKKETKNKYMLNDIEAYINVEKI